MNAKLKERVEQVIAAYDREIEEWEAVPGLAVASRQRLDSFVKFDVEFNIEAEVKILWQHINRMREHRLGVILH